MFMLAALIVQLSMSVFSMKLKKNAVSLVPSSFRGSLLPAHFFLASLDDPGTLRITWNHALSDLFPASDQ